MFNSDDSVADAQDKIHDVAETLQEVALFMPQNSPFTREVNDADWKLREFSEAESLSRGRINAELPPLAESLCRTVLKLLDSLPNE